MVKTFIIGFDGTEACSRALDHAVEAARAQGAGLHVVHVLEWSPYSFLTTEELAERHKRRQEEVTRAEAFVEPVVERLRTGGLNVSSEVRYGHPAEIMCEVASSLGASQIVIGRKGSSTLARRIIGSLGMSLIQISPVPVTVVP